MKNIFARCGNSGGCNAITPAKPDSVNSALLVINGVPVLLTLKVNNEAHTGSSKPR